jgi:autotransporter-associated beta strand protein
MDRSYGLRSLVFDATAGSFTIAAGGGSLSLSGGITNQSAKAQTFAVPVAFFGPQAIDVSSGDVTVAGAVSGTGGLSIVGGGTVTLSGGSSYAGATVLHDSKLVLAVSGDSTCAGAIAGNGTFVKNGAGALTLSGVNDFSGSTLVSKGAVILSNPNPQKLGSAIAVADGATFGVTALADGTALTVDSLTVGESTGGALQFSVVGASKVILDSKTMILNGTTTINISQSPRTVDVEYPLFSGFAKGSLVLGTEPPGVHGVLTVTGTTVNYKVTGRDFVHPGCLSTREDLLRMREKVRTGTEPWKSAYDVLANNSHSQSGYVAYPHPTPCRGGGCAQAGIAEDYMTMANDAAAAYQAALRYWIKEDTSFADAAIRNMDGYADKVQYLTGDSNVLLMQGAQGFQWASAAELLRDYQPWVASGGFKRFQTFLLEKFYNDPRINNGLSRFLELHNNT